MPDHKDLLREAAKDLALCAAQLTTERGRQLKGTHRHAELTEAIDAADAMTERLLAHSLPEGGAVLSLNRAVGDGRLVMHPAQPSTSLWLHRIHATLAGQPLPDTPLPSSITPHDVLNRVAEEHALLAACARWLKDAPDAERISKLTAGGAL